MVRRIAMLTAFTVVVLMGSAVTLAQESQPRPGGPGGGMMGPGMMPGHGMMMMCPMMGGLPGMGRMPGGDPKTVAQAMRFRADLLQAISEVLRRHAEQLEKGQ